MSTVLIPVDGSPQALRAVQAALAFSNTEKFTRVVLLNVQPPLQGRVRALISEDRLYAIARDEARKAMAAAIDLVQRAGVILEQRLMIGPVAETVIETSHKVDASQIFLGTRGRGAAAALLLGSVAGKVVHLADVPVTLVN